MSKRLIFSIGVFLIPTIVGVPVGIGLYTFYYGKGFSYLSNDPRACQNCHIMNDHYKGWTNSSHKAVATCNDCHAPIDFIGKYSTKFINGFAHSWAFTTGDYRDPLQIKDFNLKISQKNCLRCHQNQFDGHARKEACTHCHKRVGHSF
jgi:cytochrome c nitrite reductase small subunit